MTIYAIIAPPNEPKLKDLKAAVEREFGDNHFEITTGQFLVSASGLTTQKVADKIGADGRVGRFLVLLCRSQWGYHRTDLWEWLDENTG